MTALTAAVARVRPSGRQVAAMVELLEDVELSWYWPNLACGLVQAVEDIHDSHVQQCRTHRCATCRAVRDAVALLDAHDAVQSTGCGCPGCATVPCPTRGFRR